MCVTSWHILRKCHIYSLKYRTNRPCDWNHRLIEVINTKYGLTCLVWQYWQNFERWAADIKLLTAVSKERWHNDYAYLLIRTLCREDHPHYVQTYNILLEKTSEVTKYYKPDSFSWLGFELDAFRIQVRCDTVNLTCSGCWYFISWTLLAEFIFYKRSVLSYWHLRTFLLNECYYFILFCRDACIK
jgi:hypothetical protein